MNLFKSIKKRIKNNGPQEKEFSELKRVAKFFLSLLNEVEGPVHRSRFINTLRGDNKTLNLSIDHPLYGSLRDFSYKELKKYLYYFISIKMISITRPNYAVLIMRNQQTENILEFSNECDFMSFVMPEDEIEFLSQFMDEETAKKYIKDKIMKKEKDTNKIKNKLLEENKIELYPKTTNSKEEYDKVLYNLLCEKRSSLANENKIPLYMVLTNRTLKIIATQKPSDEKSLLSIHGIGKKKFDSFGKSFLEIICNYVEKNNDNSLSSIFSGDSFISKKEMEKLKILFDNGDLEIESRYKKYFNSLENLEIFRQDYNKKYVEKKLEDEKEYLDSLLKQVDPVINLDKKQREVVLRDEDYSLVVAGAGSGKTTTVAAKVKYLVDKKNISPEKILIVSYTNDAVNELKERINKQLNIPAKISTFHKVGYAIVRKTRDIEQMKIVTDAISFNIIREYLNDHLRKKPDDLKLLIMFFGFYIDAPISGDTLDNFINHFQRNDFTTLKTNIKQITEQMIDEKATKKQSIQHEVMRSLEEVQIANFLYLNSIDYQYESAYPFVLEGSSKVYTPDFTIKYKEKKIYLEHFGISEAGEHSRYSKDELVKYKKSIDDKILLHRNRQTKLIYTFSNYNDDRSLINHLKDLLEQEGVELRPRSVEDIYETIANEESNKYFNKFVFLVKDFISSFKTNGFSEKDFDTLIYKTNNVRNKLFLRISKPIYMHYQKTLYENQMIDFEDMINESARLLTNPDFRGEIPDFDYAIIDEYQDISQQRFDLAKALSDLTQAKIIAVGDDWQSIFAFAGSRIDLFLKFKDLMGYADYLTIDHTYRNAQEIIDIAGHFIQKNDSQLKKNLISPKHIKAPITLYEYSDVTYKNEKKGYKGIIYEKAKLLNNVIDTIVEQYGMNKSIALLGRYNFEQDQLGKTELFYLNHKNELVSSVHPKVKLIFSTIHKAKGLGFDNVIILNGSDEILGFPSQIEMDPILRLVKYDDRSINYAEERRLMYVALTRTKNQVHILYPKTKPSTFILELAKEYKLVKYPADIKKKIPLEDKKDKLCPNCGYPLQLKQNKAYGLKLYMCSNEPEICGYITNNLKSGKESISKCPDCMTGYLIVKHSKKNQEYFFGCTNYKINGKGCNHTKPIIEDK